MSRVMRPVVALVFAVFALVLTEVSGAPTDRTTRSAPNSDRCEWLDGKCWIWTRRNENCVAGCSRVTGAGVDGEAQAWASRPNLGHCEQVAARFFERPTVAGRMVNSKGPAGCFTYSWDDVPGYVSLAYSESPSWSFMNMMRRFCACAGDDGTAAAAVDCACGPLEPLAEGGNDDDDGGGGAEACPGECGGRTVERQRHRTCVEATNGGRTCAELGLAEQVTDTCTTPACAGPPPVDCACGELKPVSWCMGNCGGNTVARDRQRECVEATNGGRTCAELGLSEVLQDTCVTDPCPESVDCYCTEWEPREADWDSECSKVCGRPWALTVRRTCHHAQYLGRSCETMGIDVRDTTFRHTCWTKPCPVDCECGPFGAPGPCSKTCGGVGVATRTRQCSPPRYGGRTCAEVGESEEVACDVSATPCPVDCTCPPFAEWTTAACSASCGDGLQTRARLPGTCAEARHGGRTCAALGISAADTDSRPCHGGPCPQDCRATGEWAEWGACAIGCTRERAMRTDGPRHGGRSCADVFASAAAAATLRQQRPCSDGACIDFGVIHECSSEGNECRFRSSDPFIELHYGARSAFHTFRRTFVMAEHGGTREEEFRYPCDTAHFGNEDPAPGVSKFCFVVRSATTSYCAREGGTCTTPAVDQVAIVVYGTRGHYAERDESSGTVHCNNGHFGDPVHGHVKHCFIIGARHCSWTETSSRYREVQCPAHLKEHRVEDRHCSYGGCGANLCIEGMRESGEPNDDDCLLWYERKRCCAYRRLCCEFACKRAVDECGVEVLKSRLDCDRGGNAFKCSASDWFNHPARSWPLAEICDVVGSGFDLNQHTSQCFAKMIGALGNAIEWTTGDPLENTIGIGQKAI